MKPRFLKPDGFFAMTVFAVAFLAFGLSYAAESPYESSLVCAACHQDTHRNWSASLHALSYSNPIFQTAYQKAYTETGGEAKKYCLRCHAPTVQITGDYNARQAITREGVTCDFCHTIVAVDLKNREKPFVSEPGKVKRSSLKDASSPHHQTKFSADFASSKLCAGCHAFENRHGVNVGNTYNEWLASPYAKEGQQCQSCHMKQIAGSTANEGGRDNIHDHSLAHNVTSMQDAVSVSIRPFQRAADRLGVKVTVTNDRIGHAIPTGTPERHLVMEVRSHDANGVVLEVQKREYHKTVVDADGNVISSDGDVFLNGVRIAADNRLGPKESREETIVFSQRVARIDSVSADVYFSYQALVTGKTEMRVPVHSAKTKIAP